MSFCITTLLPDELYYRPKKENSIIVGSKQHIYLKCVGSKQQYALFAAEF
jgi:hypothetical protein